MLFATLLVFPLLFLEGCTTTSESEGRLIDLQAKVDNLERLIEALDIAHPGECACVVELSNVGQGLIKKNPGERDKTGLTHSGSQSEIGLLSTAFNDLEQDIRGLRSTLNGLEEDIGSLLPMVEIRAPSGQNQAILERLDEIERLLVELLEKQSGGFPYEHLSSGSQ